MLKKIVVLSLLLLCIIPCIASSAVSLPTFKLPDSWQTKCYQPTSPFAEIPCAGTGQDGAYNINPLSYTDNGLTVTDNNTGLIWQKQDDGKTRTFANAVSFCNNSTTTVGLSGSGWRLPTKKELTSIVDFSIPTSGPTIDPIFQNTSNTSYYWSSTTFASDPTKAWFADFSIGRVGSDVQISAYYVRCVNGTPQTPDFSSSDDGDTITDNNTGLTWQQGETGEMIWGDALSYCNALELGDHTDWRLPNIKELESLTDDSATSIAIDTDFFPSAISSGYLSSTTNAHDPNYAWNVDFSDGTPYSTSDKTGQGHVRCVRGGPSMTSPIPGTTLSSASPTFTWKDVGANLYVVWVGSTPGNNDIVAYPTGGTTNTHITLSGLPTNGTTLYVRLWSLFGTTWNYNDYTYTAAGTLTKAGITSPTPGTTLANGSPTFQWNNVSADLYVVWVGSTPGNNDIVAYPAGGTTNTQITLSGLPTNGTTLYVRLWTLHATSWSYNDYFYTAQGTLTNAGITSPTPGTTLLNGSPTFQWNDVGANLYVVWVGSTLGNNDIVAYPAGGTTNTQITLSGLPTNGKTLYVRLWTLHGSSWGYYDYTYTAAGTLSGAVMSSPTPGTTLLNGSPTFQWNDVGADLYVVWVGSASGKNDIVKYPAGGTTNTQITLSGLPTDGSTLYVRLWTYFGTTVFTNDYIYTAAGP